MNPYSPLYVSQGHSNMKNEANSSADIVTTTIMACVGRPPLLPPRPFIKPPIPFDILADLFSYNNRFYY